MCDQRISLVLQYRQLPALHVTYVLILTRNIVLNAWL